MRLKSLTSRIFSNTMKNKIEKQIKTTLYSILREQSQDEKENEDVKKNASSKAGLISTTGAFGSGGRTKRFVTETGSRSKTDPEGLMEDLGITKKATGEDLDAALEILKIAIYANPVMSEAYTGVKMTVDIPQKSKINNSINVIGVTPGKLDRKNAIRFLAHTLVGAQNADFLDLDGGLQFAIGQKNSIVIYSI